MAASTATEGCSYVSPIVTRGKVRFHQPARFHTSSLSPIPKSYWATLVDHNWHGTIEDKFVALVSNNMSYLVPHPFQLWSALKNVMQTTLLICTRLVSFFKDLHDALVWTRTKQLAQLSNCHHPHIFVLSSLRTTLFASLMSRTHFNLTLSHIVYCIQYTRLVNSSIPNPDCCLNKYLYGLKQVPYLWYNHFTPYLIFLEFLKSS